MARTRSLRPGFFENESLAECDPLARLLFAGLWTRADREGRLEDRPKRLKAAILPYDDCDADALLQSLDNRGFIQRYSAEEKAYIQIVNWTKHQQPHYKEEASTIPPPEGHVDSLYVAFGVSETVRQSVFDRDRRRCVNCGAQDQLTLDHVVPRSKGGTDDLTNLQTLCPSCNSVKRNRLASTEVESVKTDANSTSRQGQAEVTSTKVPDEPLELKLELDLNTRVLKTHTARNTHARAREPEKPSPLKAVPKPKPKSALTAPATLCPPDFGVTPERQSWAEKEGIATLINLERQTRDFVEYWTEGEGQGVAHKNWEITWRNRMRTQAERAERLGAGKGARSNGHEPTERGRTKSKGQKNIEHVARVQARVAALGAELVDNPMLLDAGPGRT